MRISDWSSDVCSSDRRAALPAIKAVHAPLVGVGPHVQHHAAGPETALAVATAIIEAHIDAAVLDARTEFAVEAAVVMGVQAEETAFHEIGRASCRERVCQYV